MDIPALGLAAHDWPWVLGSGPVYPETPGDTAIMTFYSPAPTWSLTPGSPWGGQKVPWYVASSVPLDAPLLIRGRQLDGPHELRFDRYGHDPMHPSAELRVRATPPFVPSTTTLARAAGCYAYQVDGPHISEVIVFQAINCRTIDRRRGCPS